MVVLLLCLIAVGGTGCTAASSAARAASAAPASSHPSAAGAVSAQPTPLPSGATPSPAGTSPRDQTRPPPCQGKFSVAPPAASASGPVESLGLSTSTVRQLAVLYVRLRCISLADLSAAPPDVEDGAVVATSGQEWAMVGFPPNSVRAPFWLLVDSQDGADIAVFSRAPGGDWEIIGITHAPVGCSPLVPAAIHPLWNMVCLRLTPSSRVA
jgi:hypothetical protein